MKFRMDGKDYELTREQVERALMGAKPGVIQKLAVFVNGEWWPVKQPFHAGLGLEKTKGVNSRVALRHLENLGFPSHNLATQGPLPAQPKSGPVLADGRSRSTAITLAVEYSKGRDLSTSDVIGVAEEFARWLAGPR